MPSSEPQLKSVLGRRDVLALAFGAMIGWGWVVLSGTLIEQAGTLGSILAFLCGGLLVGSVGLTYAELTSAMPRAGGELAFTFKAFGTGLAWVCSWALILGYVGVCAFEAVAIATVANYLFPGFQTGILYGVGTSEVYLSWVLLGVSTSLILAAVNWFGVTFSAFLQRLATILLLIVGLSFFFSSNFRGNWAFLEPEFTNLGGLFRAMMVTPFLLLGFDIIPQAAEEIRLPPRSLGKVLLASIGLASAWYVLVQWGVGISLNQAGRAATDLPTAEAASQVMPVGGLVLVAGGLLGILTSWNAFLLGGSRLIFGMARARLLPKGLAKLHPKHQTPGHAILFVAASSSVAPFLGREALLWVANAASLGAVFAYFLVAASFLRLRKIAPEMNRPYRTRYGNLAGTLALLVSLGFILLYLPIGPSALLWPYEWAIIFGWIALGVLIRALSPKDQIDPTVQKRLILGETSNYKV